MDDKLLKNFCKKYVIDISFEENYIDNIGSEYCVFSGSKVTTTMTKESFDSLVRIEDEAIELFNELQRQSYLRSKYPTLKDAYDKYQMLLEICKD